MVRSQRGVVLTTSGQQRLLQAIQNSENSDNYGAHYTIELLSTRTNLDPATVSRVLGCSTGVDKRTLQRFFQAFALTLEADDYIKPRVNISKEFWGEAPDISSFVGRTHLLQQLEELIIVERVRLIALVGVGGIGKTALSVKIAQIVALQFDYVIWQSLRNAPPLIELLNDLVQFLSNGEASDLPKNTNYRINYLFEYLSKARCLLVFDNVEAIFQSGEYAGSYLSGYEDYSDLFNQIGARQHQSCIIITSREKPKEITALEGDKLPVRCLTIPGLSISEIQDIFQIKGIFSGTNTDWKHFINNYAGNPLYLKIIATTVLDLFDGDISRYLQQNISIFGNLKNLLEQEFNRLSEFEHSVIYWLFIYCTPADINQLASDIILINQSSLLDTIESLYHRALIENNNSLFTLQPVVMEYVKLRYIETVCQEIIQGDVSLLRSHAIIQATAPDYIRVVQTRLILAPILERLSLLIGHPEQIQIQLSRILDKFRHQPAYICGYLAGNIINLLGNIKPVISNLDFSGLTIWQADLTNLILDNVNFENSYFAKSTFPESFGIIFGLAFSPNNTLLAMGSIDGGIYIWNWQDNQKVLDYSGHSNIIECVTFSSNGKLASSSRDGTIKVWDAATGQLLIQTSTENGSTNLKNLQFTQDGCFLVASCKQYIYVWDIDTGGISRVIETNKLISALFVSKQIISGASDGSVSIWDLYTGECVSFHIEGRVRAVTCTDDDRILAVTVENKTVQVWDVNTSQCLHSFAEHSYKVSLVAISNDGKMLACGCGEKTIKLWNIDTGSYHQTLEGHLSEINTLAFSTDGKVLATASVDRTARLWNVVNGKCLKTWQGCTDFIHSLAFKSDNVVISGSKHTVRIWDIKTGKTLETWHEYKDWLYSLILSPNKQWLACAHIASNNSIIRLWRLSSQAENLLTSPNKVLHGHTDSIWSIAFSSDSKIIVSGSSDRTVKIWDCETGRCLNTFIGHNRPVLSVAFSPDGKIIASCGGHSIIKLWDVTTRECVQTFKEQACYNITFSPDGETLACGSTTGIVNLWNIRSGECSQIGQYGHAVTSIAFSPDGTLACGAKDGTVQIWNVNRYSCIKTFNTNNGTVWSLAFSSDGLILVCGANTQIQLWNTLTFEHITIEAPLSKK